MRVRARRALPTILLVALGALALCAPSAFAEVVEAEGVTVGMQGRSTKLFTGEPAPAEFANEAGAPVVSDSGVYAVYWDPGDRYHGDWQKVIDGFLHNMGAASGALSSVFAVDTQYTDAAGAHAARQATFEGAYTDTSAYPAAGCTDPSPLHEADAVTCLSDAQLRTQLASFVSTHGLPKGMGTIYYLLTPPGVTVCLGSGGAGGHCSDYEGAASEVNSSYATSFCSYHSYIGGGEPGGPGTILYAAMPWTAGGLGDYHLLEEDRTPAADCQAGGWAESVEEQESPAVQQEPNQAGRGPDGSYDTGLADLIVGQIAAEQQSIDTDPLLNGWHSPSGREVTDECRDFFAPNLGGTAGAQAHTEAGTLSNQQLGEGVYFLNDAFDLAAAQLPYPAVPCLHGVSLSPSFTAPGVVSSGELVGFNGMESDVTLNSGTTYVSGKAQTTYPIYEWSFGDGTSVRGYAPGAPPANSPSTSPCELPWVQPCAASAFHSYVYGGAYTVTLKVTDTGGDTASVSQQIKVDGPAPPAPAPPPSSSPGSGSASGSSPSSGSTSGGTETSGGASSKSGTSTKSKTKGKSTGKSGKSGKAKSGKPLPRPVATALVITRSLPKAMHEGLLVRYSVNQQVAGKFEVLMRRHLARRMHIQGPAAKGLPRGAKRQIVIARHLLVTMRQAHGELRITFPPKTRRKLRRLHHLTLTLRLAVRNASRDKPKATLVQTVVKLTR